MATLRCKDPFAANVDGVPRVITGGMLVDEDDPVVRGREQFFEPVDDYMAKVNRRQQSQSAPVVEQATAAPGEKRSRGTASKRASVKSEQGPETVEPPKPPSQGTKGKD